MEEPTQPQQPKQSKTLLTVILAAAVVILGGIIAFASGLFNSSSPASQTGTTTPPATTPPATAPAMSPYKDGTYTVDQSYQSPGGTEKFDVSVTLADGVVTAATFTPMPVSGVGKMKQAAFSAAFQPQVVGKNIDDISIGVLAGASLTSAAFMQALANVKTQAKA